MVDGIKKPLIIKNEKQHDFIRRLG